ncbi:DUF6612 family protein [Guggenheimella bovis]
MKKNIAIFTLLFIMILSGCSRITEPQTTEAKAFNLESELTKIEAKLPKNPSVTIDTKLISTVKEDKVTTKSESKLLYDEEKSALYLEHNTTAGEKFDPEMMSKIFAYEDIVYEESAFYGGWTHYKRANSPFLLDSIYAGNHPRSYVRFLKANEKNLVHSERDGNLLLTLRVNRNAIPAHLALIMEETPALGISFQNASIMSADYLEYVFVIDKKGVIKSVQIMSRFELEGEGLPIETELIQERIYEARGTFPSLPKEAIESEEQLVIPMTDEPRTSEPLTP